MALAVPDVEFGIWDERCEMTPVLEGHDAVCVAVPPVNWNGYVAYGETPGPKKQDEVIERRSHGVPAVRNEIVEEHGLDLLSSKHESITFGGKSSVEVERLRTDWSKGHDKTLERARQGNAHPRERKPQGRQVTHEAAIDMALANIWGDPAKYPDHRDPIRHGVRGGQCIWASARESDHSEPLNFQLIEQDLEVRNGIVNRGIQV